MSSPISQKIGAGAQIPRNGDPGSPEVETSAGPKLDKTGAPVDLGWMNVMTLERLIGKSNADNRNLVPTRRRRPTVEAI